MRSWSLALTAGTLDVAIRAPSRALSVTSRQPIRRSKFVSRKAKRAPGRPGEDCVEAQRRQAARPGPRGDAALEENERTRRPSSVSTSRSATRRA